MPNTIRQSATIVGITPDELVVEVCRPDACTACRAKSLCQGGDDTNGKRMTLLNDRQGYEVGEKVTLLMRQSSGLKAVIIAYLIPVVLIVATLLIGQYYAVKEVVTALVALGILILYLIAIRLLRNTMNRTLTIEIEKEIELP